MSYDGVLRKDFICARCGKYIIGSKERRDSSWRQLQSMLDQWLPMSKDQFPKFNQNLVVQGLKEGKRYCYPCASELFQQHLEEQKKS